MDFNINEFNIRLRTIRIRELVVAAIISIFLALLLSFTPIFNDYDGSIVVFSSFFILLFFIFALRGTVGLKKDVNAVFLKDNFKEILFIFVINLFFAFLFVSIIYALNMSFAMFNSNFTPSLDPSTTSNFTNYDSIALILEVIAGVFLAPIVEELVFRGVLFNRLKVKKGIVFAMIVSSILFALGHEFGGMISAFLFGLCQCVLYLKTDNIFTCIMVHFLNNLTVYILEFSHSDAFFFGTGFVYILLTLAVISLILIIVYLVREIRSLNTS